MKAIIEIENIPLHIEYTIVKSVYKPHSNCYYPTAVKLLDSNIDISPILDEGMWIRINNELRKINENNT